MKNLIKIALLAALFTSCSKGDYELVDTIHNQGETVATVNGLVMNPGDQVTVPHTVEYTVICPEDCKVNINGFILYETTVFENTLKRKEYK